MKSLNEYTISKAFEYHVENKLPLYENIFRAGTKNHLNLLEYIREQYEKGTYIPVDACEKTMLEETDIGKWDVFEGENVPLDYPLFEAEHNGEEVELNKPKRGGSKKFYVYVKDGDKVKKVEWGDTSGLKIKINDPAARKSFAARHNCKDKTDKTTAGYWACRTPLYSKELGLAGGGNFFW